MNLNRSNRLELELLEATREQGRLRASVRHMNALQDRVNELERQLDSSRRVAMAFEEEIAACPDRDHHTRHVFGTEEDDR